MGCVLSTSPRPPQLDKSKAERGYVGRGNGGRPNVQKYPSRNPSKLPRREANGKNHVDGAERKGMSRERDSNSTSTSAPRRVSKKKIVADDLVDGWPKWLVDHIPRDTSAGLVPKSADSYEKLSKLGQGTYSNVYKARDRDTGKIVALKKVRFDTSEPESVKFMAREIIILQRLDHPNIIKLEGLATSRMPYSLYLVFDFMQSDLARVISQPEGRLTEPQVKCYMQQLLSGLQHCHERGILHRDIKGSNLLIDKNGVLKIADFGLANFFQPKPKKPLTSRVVTLWYRAPELLLGSTDYGVGIDLWSTGCLLAEMFIGRPIMPGRTEVEQLHKIFKLCGSPSEDYWRRRKLSTTFRPPQEYKPNFQEAFANLPMSSFSLLTTLLALEPAYRGTATSALQNEFFSSSPLACDLSGLPSIYEEDEPIMTNDPKKMRAHRKTQQPQKYSGGHKKKVSITEPAKEDSGSFIEERYSQELSSSFSSISLHRKSTGTDQESPPSSPTQAFRAYGNQYTRTQAHPNAMKNIKNFPILYAPMGNPISFEDNRLTSSSFEDNRLTLNQRSISTVDLRTADLEKISKLFGLEDN